MRKLLIGIVLVLLLVRDRGRRLPVRTLAIAEMGGRARRLDGDRPRRSRSAIRSGCAPGRRSAITAADVRVANADWGQAAELARIDGLDAERRSPRLVAREPDRDRPADRDHGRRSISRSARTGGRTGCWATARRKPLAARASRPRPEPIPGFVLGDVRIEGGVVALRRPRERAEPPRRGDRPRDHPARRRPAGHDRRRADDGGQARHPGRQRGPAAGRGRRRDQPDRARARPAGRLDQV